MTRKAKEWKALNIKIQSDIYKELEKYCEESRRTKTAIVEMALEKFLKDKKEQ